MEYQIMWGDSMEKLAKEVTKALAEGWKLQGGVCVTSTIYPNPDFFETFENYYQAMFRNNQGSN
jgi:hypothetical protein